MAKGVAYRLNMVEPSSSVVFEGRFALDDLIGAGGMGEVYRGRDLYLHQPVAIKLLKGDGTAPARALCA